MTAYKKRAHSRGNYEAPIRYADFNTKNYFEAKMYNWSMDGMYFESPRCPPAKSDICIQMVGYMPDSEGPEAYRFYRAKVRWCKQIVNVGGPPCGVGVQHIVRSHIVSGPTYTCSLCGENIPYGEIHETDDFVYLCSACFNHLKVLPDGKVKECIKNFMIGNVI